MKKLHILFFYCLVGLAGCGGGGGSTTPSPQATASTLTFNPSAALQPLYTTDRSIVSGTDRVQYSAGTPEVINNNTYQVENILVLAADNTSSTYKTYYTLNPFTLYTPVYYFVAGVFNNQFVQRTTSPFPTSARVGDFGTFEIATLKRCPQVTDYPNNCYPAPSETSSWSLNADTATTAIFCFGTTNGSQALAAQQCFKINSQNQVIQ